MYQSCIFLVSLKNKPPFCYKPVLAVSNLHHPISFVQCTTLNWTLSSLLNLKDSIIMYVAVLPVLITIHVATWYVSACVHTTNVIRGWTLINHLSCTLQTISQLSHSSISTCLITVPHALLTWAHKFTCKQVLLTNSTICLCWTSKVQPLVGNQLIAITLQLYNLRSNSGNFPRHILPKLHLNI